MAAGDTTVLISSLNAKSGAYADGVDDKISFTAQTVDLTTEAFTYSFWIKIHKSPTGQTANEGLLFGTRASIGTTIVDDGSLKHWIGGSAVGLGSITLTLPTPWVHLLVAFTGFNSSHRKLYKNGVLIGTDTSSSASSRTYEGFLGQNLHFLGANISDVRVWNRCLSAEEALSVYQGEDISTNLIHRWLYGPSDYNDGVGTLNATNTGTRLCIVDDTLSAAIKAARGASTDTHILTDSGGKQVVYTNIRQA